MPSPNRRTALKTVFIRSSQIETVPEDYLDEQGNKQTRHIVRGSVNGEAFSVECDKHVQVAAPIAEVLQGLLKKQAKGE